MHNSVGMGSLHLCSPCPARSSVPLGQCWRYPTKTLLSGSGMGYPWHRTPTLLYTLGHPPRTILFVFSLSLSVCRAVLGWLHSQLHPLMSVGLRWWNQEKNLAPHLFIQTQPPLPPPTLISGLLSLPLAHSSACPRLLPLLGWEFLSCSSCCLAQRRCFVSNLGSEHICSAFCFLPPSSLAVKHFIIQTLWKALYKMKLWGYLFWCSRSNSVSYFPPLIFSSLDNT